MRILVTGAGGMLGQDLVPALRERGHEVLPLARADLDVTDLAAVRAAVQTLRPHVVANCAAWTRVDDAESHPDAAFRVNALGPRNLAVACYEAGAALLHISTDYVFDGRKGAPYREFDLPAPLGVYGASKRAGEELVRSLCPRHWIVRTQWLYGAGGPNFVRTILRLARERLEAAGPGRPPEPLAVVNDQTGSPTYTRDLARALADLVSSPAYGTYHLTNQGACTWYEFARTILTLAGMGAVEVRPVATAELGRPASRPAYSVLENHLWRVEGRVPLRPWAEALAAFLAEGPREGQA